MFRFNYKFSKILFYLFVAFIFDCISWNDNFSFYKPSFLLLSLIYFVIFSEGKVNVGIGFFCGILIDLLFGENFGIHSLIYSIICYLIYVNRNIFLNMILIYQSVLIMLLTLIIDFCLFFIEFINHNIKFSFNFFLDSIFNLMFWFFIVLFKKN